MTLHNGIYKIRFVPPHIQLPFVGGVYATGEAINAPILAHAINPTIPGEQNWHVEAVEGKPDTYTITYPGFKQPPGYTGVGPVLPGFGLIDEKYRSHNELLRLTTNIAEWIITEVDAKFGVYNISGPPLNSRGIVGAVLAITEEHGRLLVKTFPLIPSVTLPTWQFVPEKH